MRKNNPNINDTQKNRSNSTAKRNAMPEDQSAQIRQSNTLYNALKRKRMPEDESTRIRQKNADRQRRKANQR